jgi:hypothetical protein
MNCTASIGPKSVNQQSGSIKKSYRIENRIDTAFGDCNVDAILFSKG